MTEAGVEQKDIFRLDEWKRQYSNSVDTNETFEWLKENFDADEFTVYSCMITDLPAMEFIRKNRINGYFQQFDGKLHKNAFGVGVVDQDDNTIAQFYWVFKGSEIPSEMTSSNFYESAEGWKQVNLEDNEETIKEFLFPPNDGLEHFVFK